MDSQKRIDRGYPWLIKTEGGRMYRELLQRRNRLWIWWMLFSAIHLLICASIICFYGIWRLDLEIWLSEEMDEFLEAMASLTHIILNIPAYVAVSYGDAYVTPGPRRLMLLSALSPIDSALYGTSLAGMVWLAKHKTEAQPRYLGVSPRVVGRGLFFALGYCAVSSILGIVLLADSFGLLTSYFVWRDEINTVLQLMHPLPTLLDLDIWSAEENEVLIQYFVAAMLDSAVIGVLVVWAWAWLRPTHDFPYLKASLRR